MAQMEAARQGVAARHARDPGIPDAGVQEKRSSLARDPHILDY